MHGPWDHSEEYTREFAARRDPRGVQGNPIMASMLRSVDESLGRVLAALRDNGLTENTIVVLTSDHGGNVRSNLPGYWRAMGQDERRREDWLRWADGLAADQQRAASRRQGVALRRRRAGAADRVRGPPALAPGVTTADPVMSADLYPTLLDLLDAPCAARASGSTA